MLEGRCHDPRSSLAYQPRASEGRLGKGIAFNEKDREVPLQVQEEKAEP